MVWESGSLSPSLLSKKDCLSLKDLSPFPCVPSLSPLWQLLSLLPALPDGALDTALRGDEAGSEEDLYEDVHSSSHHYSHTGGGGEQLAINEVQSGLRGWTGLGRMAFLGEQLQHISCRPGQPQTAFQADDSGTVCTWHGFSLWLSLWNVVSTSRACQIRGPSSLPLWGLQGIQNIGVVPSTYDITPVISSSMEDLLGRKEDRG